MKACRLLVSVLSVCLISNTLSKPMLAMFFKAPIKEDKPFGYFIENIGQWNSEIHFMTYLGAKQIIFFDAGFSVYDTHSKSNTPYKLQSSSFQIFGKELLSSSSSYFYGQDPKQWRPKARHFAKVLYQSKTEGTSIEYSINSCKEARPSTWRLDARIFSPRAARRKQWEGFEVSAACFGSVVHL